MIGNILRVFASIGGLDFQERDQRTRSRLKPLLPREQNSRNSDRNYNEQVTGIRSPGTFLPRAFDKPATKKRQRKANDAE